MPHHRSAVYPGTFDPPTLGHLDIIKRGRRLCDRLVVAVAANPGKGPMFTLAEREAMVRRDTAAFDGSDGLARVEVTSFSSLLMDFAVEQDAGLLLRGLRAVSDFEYEFQMAGMNAKLNREVETVFLMASEQVQFISSRFVKEIALLGGDVSGFITGDTHARLMAAIAALKASRTQD